MQWRRNVGGNCGDDNVFNGNAMTTDFHAELRRWLSFQRNLNNNNLFDDIAFFERKCSDDSILYKIATTTEFSTELQRWLDFNRNASEDKIFYGNAAHVKLWTKFRRRSHFLLNCSHDCVLCEIETMAELSTEFQPRLSLGQNYGDGFYAEIVATTEFYVTTKCSTEFQRRVRIWTKLRRLLCFHRNCSGDGICAKLCLRLNSLQNCSVFVFGDDWMFDGISKTSETLYEIAATAVFSSKLQRWWNLW